MNNSRHEYTINLASLRDPISLGVRRSAAFLRIGLAELESREVLDLNFAGGFQLRVWPDKAQEEQVEAAKAEYRYWLPAACLAELDAFLCAFLDKASWISELANLHGQKVRSDHVVKPLTNKEKNSANKYRLLSSQIEIDDLWVYLNSMRLARNCLLHNFGLVRVQDTNERIEGALRLAWLAYEVGYSRAGIRIVPDAYPFDTYELPGDGEVTIDMRIIECERVFHVGNRVRLSEADIASLCFFYLLVADKVIASLSAELRKLGIGPSDSS